MSIQTIRSGVTQRGPRVVGVTLCLVLLVGCSGGGSEDAQDTAAPPEAATATATEDLAPTTVPDPAPADADAATTTAGTDMAPTTEGSAGHDDSTVTVTVTAPPSQPEAATAPPEELAESGPADELVTPAVVAQARALAAPEALDTEELADVTDDTMLDQIRAIASDYAMQGWTQVGVPQVVRSEIVDLNEQGDPPTARAEVCLDHSQVDIVDAEGESMRDPDAQMRVLTIYELEFTDDRWRVVRQTFPDETDC
ncbi:hypothetical protein [Ornithinicoccus halotolerans]|uniref:hypothetical protein n=1 Tax=Ornithinicoccus halotolerans TaxID=1748220 RepID=UPI00129708DA|nr:hypothetical protein [Ornithinicoccus halotolerans]